MKLKWRHSTFAGIKALNDKYNKQMYNDRAQTIPFSCHPVGGKTLELKAETVFQELWLTLPVQGP